MPSQRSACGAAPAVHAHRGSPPQLSWSHSHGSGHVHSASSADVRTTSLARGTCPHLGSTIGAISGVIRQVCSILDPIVQISDPINLRRPDGPARRMGGWSRSTARRASRTRWQQTWEAEGLYNADPDPRAELRDRAPAAERDRRSPPRPRAAALARRHDRAHAADAGLQRALPARLRPRRASRRRTPSRSTSRSKGRRATTSAARRSRRASGSGCASTAARSWSSSAGSAPRSTTAASASRWTTPTCAR